MISFLRTVGRIYNLRENNINPRRIQNVKIFVFCFVFIVGAIAVFPDSQQSEKAFVAHRGSVDVQPDLMAHQTKQEIALASGISITHEYRQTLSIENRSRTNNGYRNSIAEARVSAGQNIVPPS